MQAPLQLTEEAEEHTSYAYTIQQPSHIVVLHLPHSPTTVNTIAISSATTNTVSFYLPHYLTVLFNMPE